MFSLTYIYHDCFILETDEAVFLFDYWKDPLAGADNKDFPPLLSELDMNKPVYVLVSHHHKDHFSRRIFLWEQRLPDINYIISRDVLKAVRYMLTDGGTYAGFRPSPDRVHVLSEHESFADGIVRITAFGSTDIGNSYAVECGGYSFFHAGDLNAWLWIDESSPEEVEESRRSYVEIVDSVRSLFPSFDLALFPVDSRLGREYWWGAKYFVDSIRCGMFVPMHFELVLDEKDKRSRKEDAGAFSLYARKDFGSYLLLTGTRSRFLRQ